MAPCIIPFLINIWTLWPTIKGSWRYFLKYPQFLVSPCFTPFVFKSCEASAQQGEYKIKIWKFGTILNALYIGCIPQCILCIAHFYRGIHQWEFIGRESNEVEAVFERNDAIFKSQFGNVLFATTTALFFFLLIIYFFGSKSCLNVIGISCRCPNPLNYSCIRLCTNLSGSEVDQPPSPTTFDENTAEDKATKPATEEKKDIDVNHTPNQKTLIDSHSRERHTNGVVDEDQNAIDGPISEKLKKGDATEQGNSAADGIAIVESTLESVKTEKKCENSIAL